MPKQFRYEDPVTSADMNDLFDDAVPAYRTVDERRDDWIQPIVNLYDPLPETDIPLGAQAVVGGTDKFYGAWNGVDWKPWHRLTTPETGLLQVVVNDIVVEEDVSGNVTARFRVWIVNARATIVNYTDPTYDLEPEDLQSRVVRCDARLVEYDPRPYGERTRDVSYTEAIANSDFQPVVVTLTWRNTDTSPVKIVEATIYSNPEDRGALPDGSPRLERCQLELFNFRGVRPLKPIGICSITNTQLPFLRVEDVVIRTDRTSDTDPNIGAQTYTIPIRLSEAPGVDVNFRLFTEDDTAVQDPTQRDYVPFDRTITIRADATTPDSPVTGTLPNQLLEATERFYVRALPVVGENPPILFIKPRASITIEGRALRPTLYAPSTAYGPGFGGASPINLPLYLNMNPAPTAATGPVTVNWRTDDDLYLSGTIWARPNYHYVPKSGSTTFQVGESRKEIDIQTAWTYKSIPTSPRLYERETDVDLRVEFTSISSNAELGDQYGTIQLYGETGTDVEPPVTVNDVNVIEGTPIIVNAVLGTIPAVNAPASVDWTIRTGSGFGNAAIGVHFQPSATSGTFSWGGGTRNLTRFIRINTIITPGSTIPNPRYFTIQLSNPQNCTLSRTSIIVTIDDEAGVVDNPILTGSDLSVREPPAGFLQIGFVLRLERKDPGNTAPYTFDYATEQATAVANENFIPISRTGHPRGSLSADGTDDTVTILIWIQAAQIDEPKHFFLVIGDAVRGGTHSGNLTLPRRRFRITILPRETRTTALPSMTAADVRVRDDAGQAEVVLTLSRPAPAGAQVDYATQDGTGKAGTNYTATSGTATWPTGGTETTISIPIQPDNRNTDNHTFRVLFSGAEQCTIADSRADVTILNTGTVRPPPEPEAPPVITIADTRLQNPASGTTTGRLTISTSRTVSYPITGRITGFNGTGANAALAGTHFNAFSGQPWTIPAGSSSTSYEFTVRSATLTADVSFTATLTIDDGVEANIGDSTARITITRAPEPPTIRVEDLDLTDSSRTGLANVVITRTGDLRPITFDVQTVDGSARSGLAYTGFRSTEQSMGQGVRSITVGIPIIPPTSRTPQQVFYLRATNLSEGTISRATGTITLPAYEPVVTRVIQLLFRSEGAVTEPGPGSRANAIFTIQSTEAAPETIGGTFSTENINSAIGGQDYQTIRNRRWSIGRGARSTRILVPILADNVLEQRERFRAIATIDTGNAEFANRSASATATGIIDNRLAGVTIAVQDLTVLRRGTTARVRVNKTGTTNSPVYYVASTYGTNSAGTDEYTQLSGQQNNIPAAASFDNIDIPIPSPSEDKGITNFGVRIGSPRGATITDADARVTLPAYTAPSIIAFSAPVISVVEYSTATAQGVDYLVSVPVLLSRRLDQPVTFNYDFTLTGTDRLGPGRILRERSGLVSIPPGLLGTAIPLGGGQLADEPRNAPYIRQRRVIGDSRLLRILGSVFLGLGTLAIGGLGTAITALSPTLYVTQTTITGWLVLGSSTTVATQIGVLSLTVAGIGGALTTSAVTSLLRPSVTSTGGGYLLLGSVVRNSDVVAVGPNSITGDSRTELKEATNIGSLTARLEISNIRGPVINREAPTLTTTF